MMGNVTEIRYDGVDIVRAEYDGGNDRVDVLVVPRVESLTIGTVIKTEG